MHNRRMTISVVIPTYNEEKMLPRLLVSLKNQKGLHSPFEIIVVDNNSTDKTADIARKYGAKVLFQPRRGVTYARNTGCYAAKGDIIVGTDADSILPPNYLASIVKQFRNKNIVGLCGGVYLPDAPVVIRFFTKVFTLFGEWHFKQYKRPFLCWAANFSFRRDAFLQIGGYDLNLPLLIAGIDAQGSDQYGFVKKLLSTKKTVVFNKDIIVDTSGRRFKNRLLYWFFVEYLVGYLINSKLYMRFGKLIPTPSCYDKIIPSKSFNYAVTAVFIAILFLFSVSLVTPAPPQLARSAQSAQKAFKKALLAQTNNIKDDIETLSQKLKIQAKITPYLSNF